MSLSQSSEINLTDNGKQALNAKKLANDAQATADSAINSANNAYDLANGAQKTADGKNSVFRGADPNTIPTSGLKEGDIYFTNNVLYTWNGSTWEKTVSDTTGAEINAKVDKAMAEKDKAIADMRADINADVAKINEEIKQTNIKTGNALNFYKEQYYLSTSYTELKGGSWSDTVPTKTPGKYVWSRYVTSNIGDTEHYQYGDPVCISGLDGETGPRGLQGLQGPKGDQGIQGPQGVSSYTHIAYANSEDGKSDFDIGNGSGKDYIGVYVDSNPTDSTDPTKYMWSLIKGEQGNQGIPGAKGVDGRTPYLHIAYANSSDGTVGFDVGDSFGKLYIGQYTDYIPDDSTKPSDYSWTKIKGDTGATGAQGPQGTSFKTFTTNYRYNQNDIDKFSDSSYSGVWVVNESTSDLKIGDIVQLRLINSSKSGYCFIIAKVTAIPGDKSIKCTSLGFIDKGDTGQTGATGPQGPQGVAGAKGVDGQTTYVHVAYANSADGGLNFNTNYFDNALYVGVLTDYTQADSTDHTKYTWSRLKGDKGDTGDAGPRGLQGLQGPKGDQGIQGPKGVSFKTFTTNYTYNQNDIDKFSDSSYSSVWAVNESTSDLKIGDTVQLRLTNSSKSGYCFIIAKVTAIPDDKSIACTSSGLIDKGDIGQTGATGPQGASSYTHIAYSNSSDGQNGFDVSNSTGKTYIGVYVDSNPKDSTDPTKYAWTLIKGERGDQGVPGAKGADGRTPYFHIAYANSADGKNGFDTSNSSGKLYIGQYTDYTQADSTNPANYAWTKIKGDTGASFKTFTTNYTYNQNDIDKFSDSSYSGVWAVNESTSDLKIGDTVQLRLTNSSKSSYCFIIAKVTAIPNDKSITCASSGLVDKGDIGQTGATGPQGPKGDTGAQGIPGPKGDNGQTTYVHFAYANSADGRNDFNVSYFSNALYIGTYTDYSQTDSNDYTKYTWSRLKGDTGASFKTFTTNYTYNQNEINSYSSSGYGGTWAVNESTSDLKIGDIVQLRLTNSSKSGYCFIIAKVTAIPGDKSIKCTSLGLVDKGETGATGPKGDRGDTGFFTGNTPPSNPAVGTVWATNDSSGHMNGAKKWDGSKWVSTAFTQDLVAGNISASKIQGGELDVNKITVKNAQNIPITSTVSLGKKLSDIEQDAEKISHTLRDGGTNLLNNSQGNFQPKKGITSNWETFKGVDVFMSQGENYTVSAQSAPGFVFSGTDDRSVESNRITLWLTDVKNPSFWQIISSDTTDISQGGTHFTWNHASGLYTLCVNTYKKDNSGYAYHVQIEHGDIATPWSPSSGDISTTIQTANSLTNYVKGSRGSKTLESILSMDPDHSSIAQVVNGQIAAAIGTYSDGSVRIDGKALYINADTKIENATIKSAMIDSIEANKIKSGTLDASQIRVINLDANSITTGSLSAVVKGLDLNSFETYVVSSSNTWDFNYTKSSFGNWFLVGETKADHVYNGPSYYWDRNQKVIPYMYVTSRGTADGRKITVTVWKDNDPTQYQRIWDADQNSWSDWVVMPNSQNIVSTINLSPDGVKISGKKIQLDGNTTVTGRLDLMQNQANWVEQSTNYHNRWRWTNAHIYFDKYLQLLGEDCFVEYTNTNTLLNGSNRFYSITTLTPGYLKFTTYRNKVNATDENFDGQISRSYLDSGRLETPEVYTDKFAITGHHIRVRDNKYLMVTNKNGTNFDGNGSVAFQVWGGIALGKQTIGSPSGDIYFQQGNVDGILGQDYSAAPKVTLHADHIASQSANTITSRLSTKTDITKVTYNRALAAVEGTEMYDYRYVSDDSGQHYVSGIIDDVNPDPQYHMDDMLINKERTARIDANLVGYHHVVLQELLKKVDKLQTELNELKSREK